MSPPQGAAPVATVERDGGPSDGPHAKRLEVAFLGKSVKDVVGLIGPPDVTETVPEDAADCPCILAWNVPLAETGPARLLVGVDEAGTVTKVVWWYEAYW